MSEKPNTPRLWSALMRTANLWAPASMFMLAYRALDQGSLMTFFWFGAAFLSLLSRELSKND